MFSMLPDANLPVRECPLDVGFHSSES